MFWFRTVRPILKFADSCLWWLSATLALPTQVVRVWSLCSYVTQIWRFFHGSVNSSDHRVPDLFKIGFWPLPRAVVNAVRIRFFFLLRYDTTAMSPISEFSVSFVQLVCLLPCWKPCQETPNETLYGGQLWWGVVQYLQIPTANAPIHGFHTHWLVVYFCRALHDQYCDIDHI